MRKILSIVGILLVMFMAGVSYAGESVEELKRKAEHGDPNAQYELGIKYLFGEAIDKDYVKAVEMLTKSALQNNEKAIYSLVMIYYEGKYIQQDLHEAAKWAHIANKDNNGNALTQYYLGNLYYYGKGVLQDYKEAVKWYSKSAEQGYADAKLMLGVIYAEGKAIEKNYIQAHKYSNLAAYEYSKSALTPEYENTKALELRSLLEKDMSPAQIAEAQRLASEWVKAHEKK